MDPDAIAQSVKAFVLSEFLPGEDPDELKHDTGMFSQGILDSLASLKLVAFIENEFDVSIEAHEVDEEYLDTLDAITNLVLAKIG